MNSTQVMGLVRDLIKTVGMVAVFLGYLDEATLLMVAGAVGTLAASAWSWYTNKTTSMVAAVADSATVKKVVMATPALANATPALADSPKVTAS